MRKIRWRAGAVLMGVILAGSALWISNGAVPAEAAGPHRVRISHAKFVPAEIRISAGDRVEWVNEDHDAHSITADDGSFDSHPDCSEDAQDRCLPAGSSWSRTFADPGRYAYHSKTEGQKGVVVVNPKG
jgi:plastocyanin